MVVAKNPSRRRVARVCVACGADQPKYYGIPDPCLGMLPGVNNACCGHGCKTNAYVQMSDGNPVTGEGCTVYRGIRAQQVQIRLGGKPAKFYRPLDEDLPKETTKRQAHMAWQGWRRV